MRSIYHATKQKRCTRSVRMLSVNWRYFRLISKDENKMKNITKIHSYILGLICGGLWVWILFAIIAAYKNHHSGAIIFFSTMAGLIFSAIILIGVSIDQSNQ